MQSRKFFLCSENQGSQFSEGVDTDSGKEIYINYLAKVTYHSEVALQSDLTGLIGQM